MTGDHLAGSLVRLLTGMARHDSARLADHHLLIADPHRHVLSHQGRWHAVPVPFHLHAAILGDTATELLLRQERGLAVQRHQRLRPGLIQSQAELSPRLGSRQPKRSNKPLMAWARASSPWVMDQNPPRRRAFNRCAEGKAYAKLRSVAITCRPLRSP
jgi:hypothetical protein